jgi:sugar phosphate isomerase/epimerase
MTDRWPLSAFADEIAVDLEEQVETLSAERVGHVELRSAWGVNVVDLGPERLRRAVHVLREAGIGVSAVGSPVGKAPVDGDLQHELRRFRAALEAADALGTGLIRVFSFFVTDGRYAEQRDEVLRRMSALATEAEANGVTLVHENESYIYGDTPGRCRDLVDSVASPALRLAFDPANFVQAGVRPHAEAWPLLADHVAHFHVKDAVTVDRQGGPSYPAPAPELALMGSVRLPGEGEGQLPELLGELASRGYAGFLTIEPHLAFRMPEASGDERFAAATRALRDLVEALDR